LQKSKQQSQSLSLNDRLKAKQKQAAVEHLSKNVLGGCKLAAVFNPQSILGSVNPTLSSSTSSSSSSSSSSSNTNGLLKSLGGAKGISDQLLSLINVKSSHASEVMEEDGERCEATLNQLEAKDIAHQELEKITEQKCNAYHCDQVMSMLARSG
jgi:hypothetical protein